MKLHSGLMKGAILVCIGVLLSGTAFIMTDLTGLTITGTATYTDPDELTVSNSTVEPGGDLTLKAGNVVRLKPGFNAKQGSELTVQIDPSLQGFHLSSLPPTTENDRFLDEVFPEMERPGLSIVGFDNFGDNSKGLGLKQILYQVYNSNNEQRELFKSILTIADNNIDITPPNAEVIEENSNILQYLAFEALCSYVLYKNGITPSVSLDDYGIPIRDHQLVLSKLKNAMVTLAEAEKLTSPGGDYVKHTATYTNIARAIDLYLALENAYKFWDYQEWENSWKLLSKTEKTDLMTTFIADLQNLYDNEIHYTNRFLGLSTGINDDEVEPGNRPLKGYLALGYSLLAIQNATGWEGIDERFAGAKSRASDYSGGERTIYWNYQTSEGERYWAEGPYYFNFALLDVVPFWHATRANGMLGSVRDPFKSRWFLDPVEWLADVSTPDGLTPSLDDGNKHRISAAPMLRWSSGYGNEEIGKKFNEIYQTTNQYRNSTNKSYYSFPNTTWLLELAIPNATSTIPITYDIKEGGEQQLIVRHQDSEGRLHYVLLNGERGNAIKRGEGHEQPDQLQLLYYVDGTSYLMDTGYDKPQGIGINWERSSWNNWYNHNVIVPYGDYIQPPQKGWFDKHGFKKRIISNYKHPDVQGFNYTLKAPKIVELKGSVTEQVIYESQNPYTGEMQTYGYDLSIERKVLFIKGSASIGNYLIDFNSSVGAEEGPNAGNRKIYYYGNSSLIYEFGNWFYWLIENKRLNIFLKAIEFEDNAFLGSTLNTQEYHRKDRSVRPLHFSNTQKGEADYVIGGEWNKHFNTIAILKVSSAVPRQPQPIFSYSNSNEARPHQGWYWQHDANTIDVIIKRSKVDMTWYNADINFDVIDGNLSITYLRLPAGKDYGFARFRKVDGEWEIDSNYQINLERSPPPFSVSISGPRFLASGQPGTWTANPVSAGDSPTYKWYRRETLNDSWSYTDVTTQSYNSYFFNTGSQSKEAGVKVALTAWGQTVSAIFNVSISSSDCNTTIVAISDVETNSAPPPCNTTAKAKGMRFKVIPESFELYSNYPNPFSPSTTIRYGIPEQADVTIRVYNILGRRVATLVNETKSPGFYNIRFVADRLASGLYIARIIAEGVSGKRFVKELKMQLIK